MNRDCQVAWAAGLFEGEGTFGFRKVKSGRAPADMRLVMCDKDVVKAFHEVVGVGKVYIKSIPSALPHHRPQWQWIVSGMEDMKTVIELLRPYLKSRRAAAADEALEYINKPFIPSLQLGSLCVNGHRMTAGTLHEGSEKTPRHCRVCRAAARERWKARAVT